jgi:hypothetical protein
MRSACYGESRLQRCHLERLLADWMCLWYQSGSLEAVNVGGRQKFQPAILAKDCLTSH